MKGNDYRLNNGHLAYAIEKEDVTPYADAVAALSDYVQTTLNKPFLYVQFPFKIDPNDPQLPPGGEDYSHQNTEEFLNRIKAKGVPVYDLRAYFNETRPDHYSLFYRTDHHWKAETGFLAAKELNRYLTAQDAAFAVDERVFDQNSYQAETRDNFLGRLGLRFGPYFCGYDSFSAISPKYALDLAAYNVNGKLLHRGGAEGTVLFPKHLTYSSPYNCSMYCYYMDGGPDYRRLVNRTQGLKLSPKKLLIIKDSFANAMVPYLIYGYEEVTIVDMRSLKTPLTEVIEQADPDLVMVAYNPGALIPSEARMFEFFESDRP